MVVPRIRGSLSLLLCLALGSALAPAADASGEVLPTGFVLDPIASDWVRPVGLWYVDAARLLVSEKAGRVWYVENGIKKNLVIDLSDETLTPTDRGLLGVAADPQFDVNGWLYFLLVVDPNGDGADVEQESFSRLLRYTASYDQSGDLLADPASRTVLLGDTWTTGLPSCHTSHAIGNLRFFSDGSLVLTCGDGAHFDKVDNGGNDPGCFGAGKLGPADDIGSYRSAVHTSLAGKVLRIDPATGLGLPDNPWFTGDPAAPQSRQWALGLRNPFRFTLLAGSGPRERMVIGDVGWNRWEELNLCAGGEHFGWPCVEGPDPSPYTTADPYGICAGIAGTTSAPLLGYHHVQSGSLGFKGNCISGVVQYTGARYPPLYKDRLFFCEYTKGWMRSARLNADDTLSPIDLFGDGLGNPITLVTEPEDGDLVYVDLKTNQILRLRFVGVDQPPLVVARAAPTFGPAPLAVDFSASASSDPEGGPLAFHWDFGDGSASDEADVQHVYTASLNVTATLSVSDLGGHVGSATFPLSPDNTPPVIDAVNTPLDGLVTSPGDTIFVDGSAHDAEDDANGQPLTARWDVDLLHNHHEHPDVAHVDGFQGSFVIDTDGPGTWHRLTLHVTDSRGLEDTRELELYDRSVPPAVHLVSISDEDMRLGQHVRGVGHVEYAITKAGWPKPALSWDWGDGTVEDFGPVGHQVDVQPSHTYAAIGDYTVTLTSTLGAAVDSVSVPVKVRAARSAVAIFQPLLSNRWISWQEQPQIAADLVAALEPQGREVRAFTNDEQDELAQWMLPYLDDSIVDVLIVLDTIPARLYQGEDEGSLAERWLEHGNGIVWTGFTPFYECIFPDGMVTYAGAGEHGADEIFDNLFQGGLCSGNGLETPNQVGTHELPSMAALGSVFSDSALRRDYLTAPWHVVKNYAEQPDHDSGEIAIGHPSGGFFAQLLTRNAPALPRAQVLLEFLASFPNRSWVDAVKK